MISECWEASTAELAVAMRGRDPQGHVRILQGETRAWPLLRLRTVRTVFFFVNLDSGVE